MIWEGFYFSFSVAIEFMTWDVGTQFMIWKGFLFPFFVLRCYSADDISFVEKLSIYFSKLLC